VSIALATNSILITPNAQLANEGIYQVVITNNAGAITSSIARVRVLPPSSPVIAPDFLPGSLSMPAGSDVFLSVHVRGSPPLFFQWFKDDLPLFEGNSAELGIANAQRTSAGNYWVVVSNTLGSSTSSITALQIVDSRPFFVIQPLAVTVTNGTTVSLSVVARGSEPLGYHWRKGGTVLPDQTTQFLTLHNVTLAAADAYDLIASNAIGMSTSAVAQVTVLQAPLFQSTLTNLIVDAGSTVALGVEATGVPTLNYIWYFNNLRLSDANDSTLVLTNIQTTQSGYYQLIVSNLLGNISSVCRLSVFGPPSTVVAWGDDSADQIYPPKNLNDVVSIAGGDFHSVALRHNGSLAAWGYNGDGQTTIPTNDIRFVAISSGSRHNLALAENGTIAAWGANESQQLNVPAGVDSVIGIAAGDSHSLALLVSGAVLAWGNNSFGQGTVPGAVNGIRAIAAGRNHNLALRSNGTVASWGLNNFGQASPPAGLTAVTAVAAGYLHSAALLSNRTVIVWGDNTFGQTNVPSGLSNIVAVTAGDFHTLALRADGGIVGWGDDAYGQIDPPQSLIRAESIASGYYHSLALVPSLLLHYRQSTDGLILWWNTPAVLQWSPTLNGSYVDLLDFFGSYTNKDFGGDTGFFRLRRN
jgi:alpha-tubulin suppressor-like RCC1 family protein